MPFLDIDSSTPLHIHLKAATFDPLVGEPKLPASLKYENTAFYFLVQCNQPLRNEWAVKMQGLGVTFLGYIPDYTYLVHAGEEAKQRLLGLPYIRWVGVYHPGYKISKELAQTQRDLELSIQVFMDSEENPVLVRDILSSMGARITSSEKDAEVIRIITDAGRIPDIARIPQVAWLEEYTYPVALMNHVRVFTGAETLHSQGVSGTGIVGEVKDNGIDQSHPDFEGQILDTDGNPTEAAHGTSTFGIVFSSGANNQNAEGMMPDGQGVFCDWGVGRGQSVSNLVNIWGGVFQSNSWHMSGQTDGTYNTNSMQNDEAVFDYDVSMLYAAGNSNDGVYESSISTDAAAKNIITVGAVTHYNDRDRTNDKWVNWGAGGTPSQGPASDGRIKPDVVGVFDSIYTTDSTVYTYDTGQNGYSQESDYYSSFGGTSGATPIVAGASGLVYQLYRDDFFGNNPEGAMPHASTVKAILIADAYQYEFSQANRFQQGWGLVDLENVYNIAKNHLIVNEEVSLRTGENITFLVAPRSSGPMKISLVWTDVPGTTSSSQHLVNDLNLKVTDPQGNVYLGNVGLQTSKWSGSGGTADTLNNVENVFIQNPISGNWSIEVAAQNIALDGNPSTIEFDQHFALVASNVLQDKQDMEVEDLDVNPYVAPYQVITVSATINNDGMSEAHDITVNFTIDGVIKDSKIISSLGSGNSTQVSFQWTPDAGIFLVGVDAEILPDEELTQNNFASRIVIAEPDVSVLSISVPRFFRPNQEVVINATIFNPSKVNLSDVEVQMLVNGTVKDIKTIASLASQGQSNVSFFWTPTVDGWFEIEVFAPPQPDEELVADNRMNSSILITSSDPIVVALVDSWGTDNAQEAPWDYLNDNWVEFGTHPVIIDYQTLNKKDFTYNDIIMSNADVLFISMAIYREYSQDEIEAISNYVLQGHGLVATAGTFYHDVPNNNNLAYLFGLQNNLSCDMDQTPSIDLLNLSHPLFGNVPNPLVPGSQWTSVPSDGTWGGGDLKNGTYLGKSQDDKGAIVVRNKAVYISHWVEYQSTEADMQLLYNAMIWSRWEREDHDIFVFNLEAKRYLDSGEGVAVNATVLNLGLFEEKNIPVSFYVDGIQKDQVSIPSLAPNASQQVSFVFNAESHEGMYTLRIEAQATAQEAILDNNYVQDSVIVSDGPALGKIGLVSDESQLQAVRSVLDELNRTYDTLDDNTQNRYTRDIMLLLNYQMVIFYNNNRLIDSQEHRALNDYIELGGYLVVTGFDSLGAPDDPLLADIVRSTTIGDDMGKGSFTVTDDTHPIMDGVFGVYPTGNSYSVTQTDHDFAEADVTRGALTVAELPDGYDKIISCQLSSGGRVIYWNGNGDCDDWLQSNINGMFRNLIIWLVPIFNDIGIVSLQIPQVGFVEEPQTLIANILNYGLNDSIGLQMLLEVRDSLGSYLYHSELKSGISLASRQSKDISFLWTPSLSYIYSIRFTLFIQIDEIPLNNMAQGQVTVHFKFHENDMEGGSAGWSASASSFTPLWHLTSAESHSPTTSWWCGQDSSSQYTVLGEQYLMSPAIDLQNASSAILSFYHRFEIDDNPLGGDWGWVEINGGAGWTALDSYAAPVSFFNEVILNLSAYTGSTIRIRFHLGAGLILSDNGWWVDDVLIFGFRMQWGVALSAESDTDSAGPTEYAEYVLYVNNTGNVPSNFEMNLTGSGTENWLVEFSPSTFPLAPHDVQQVMLRVMPNGTVAGFHSFTVIGEAVENGFTRAWDAAALYMSVSPRYKVNLTTDSNILNLVPGETKSREITATNMGNDYDTIALITDMTTFGSSSPWTVILSQGEIDLGPFESQNITLTVTSPQNGISGDFLYVNVTAASLRNASETAIISTTSNIIDLFSLEVQIPDAYMTAGPGIQTEYQVLVGNHGNTQVTVDMEIIPVGSWEGWIAFFENDSFVLDAFSQRNVNLFITSPSKALENSHKEFDVKAQTPNNLSTARIGVQINRTGDIQIFVLEDRIESEIGNIALYYITVTNTQNANDTVNIKASSQHGWKTYIYSSDKKTILSDTDSDKRPDSGPLEPWDDWVEVVLGVEVPKDIQAGFEDKVTLTFISSLPNGSKKSADLFAKAAPSGSALLDALSYSESEAPGSQVTYWITLTNQFNYDCAIDVKVTSKSGWELDVRYGDGVSDLDDTNQNGIPDTGPLDALGGRVDIMVILDIPSKAPADTKDIVTVTASSSTYQGTATSISLNATVLRVHDIRIEREGKDLVGSSGGKIEFAITISNLGNSEEALDLRFSELPFGWRGYLSNDEPVIPIEGWKVITVTLDIPSDAESGGYMIYLRAASDDGVGRQDLTVSVEVREKDEGIALPLLILLLLAVAIIVLVLVLVLRRKDMKDSVRRQYVVEPQVQVSERHAYGPILTPSVHPIAAQEIYKEPVFPIYEKIGCPACYTIFEIEAGRRPIRVQCPACGASGIMR